MQNIDSSLPFTRAERINNAINSRPSIALINLVGMLILSNILVFGGRAVLSLVWSVMLVLHGWGVV